MLDQGPLLFPVTVTAKSKTYRVTATAIEELFDCNHEEVDSRLVSHAIIEDSGVVVVAEDTNVLVLMLMVLAYAKCNIKRNGIETRVRMYKALNQKTFLLFFLLP